MSQGGIGHWLNKRREPGVENMNRVLKALGMDFLEVALVIREPRTRRTTKPLTQKYNRTFATRSVTGRQPLKCATENGRSTVSN
jgi:hypothetical protein